MNNFSCELLRKGLQRHPFFRGGLARWQKKDIAESPV